MGFTRIWERYFLKEVLKTVILFLVCFYGLYVLIDYTNHGRSFHQRQGIAYLQAFLLYYAYEFVVRSEVLIPFAILLGTIRTLCKLNTNNELVAMMVSGVTISRLLRPFLLLGLLFTAAIYCNLQYLVPLAAKGQKFLDDAHSGKKKNRKSDVFIVEHLALIDGSTLLFQSFDSVSNMFFDVYWVRSIDEIYRIRNLYPYNVPPRGEHVDHLLRNEGGELLVAESLVSKEFNALQIDALSLGSALAVAEEMSLVELWQQLPTGHVAESEKEARLLATFHRKLALPWLCLLGVMAPAPFCMRFSRQFPAFAVYAASLFGLIAVYIVLDAVHVLGRRQLVDPLYALWTPLTLFFLLCGWRYVRLR
jgi:lipopolysaccharide export system permease protein